MREILKLDPQAFLDLVEQNRTVGRTILRAFCPMRSLRPAQASDPMVALPSLTRPL